ncbi:MAG: hypothetical protein ACRDTM_03475 [Micromonosporaceae bacterium]
MFRPIALGATALGIGAAILFAAPASAQQRRGRLAHRSSPPSHDHGALMLL